MRAPRFPLFLALLLAVSASRGSAATVPATVTVAAGQNHLGWSDAIVLRNGLVEAVVVPSVGRVMQFRFLGENDGPFWENEKLAGQPMPKEPWKAAHGSFGGDKTWPAPQSAWDWPPPDVFDAAVLTARVNDDRTVTLTSPPSPRFGLRTVRRISLDVAEPVMRIETTYEKLSGPPLEVSVWIITQLRDPVAVFLPVPAQSMFPTGLAPQWTPPPGAMQRTGDLLRFIRDPAKSYKIGNDAPAIVWAGEKQLLKISTPRPAGETYPDGGCTAELYGNADPVRYVELETVGPLKRLANGETLTATNTYHLARRTAAGIEADVRALLGR
ncbi:MAG: hypothetical protein NTV51_06735 [Verrucomicrobia bacterium]|nr:hypothetical protein [Verrucomicrobiota bacterium]